MSANDAFVAYGTIVIVGGGCYGSYYVRQLSRAIRANALSAKRLVIVDRDPACAVAGELESDDSSSLRRSAPSLGIPRGESVVPMEIVVSDWREFFDSYLTAAAERPSEFQGDAIVPSPLMPHLMGEWLVNRARARFGDVETRAFDRLPPVPWERAGENGTHYVSFATWMCPINCIEPRICPHTRDARTWSLPETLAAHDAESAVLFCRHRAYGVGMFDTAEVIAADARIRAAGERGQGESDIIIGTVSHCHGALTRLVIHG